MKYLKNFESSEWEEQRKKRELEINQEIPREGEDSEIIDREELRKSREEIINQEIIDATIKSDIEENREAIRKRRESELVKKFR